MARFAVSAAVVVFTNNLLNKMGVGPDGLLGQDVYEWLDFDNYRSLDTMPEYAMNKYRCWGAEIKDGKHRFRRS